jgi:BirA family biotin operon repressor/biotin-[acetyl-CoA-carboxylase] ligase
MASLDFGRIENGLTPATRSLLSALEVFDTIGSTNTYLAAAAAPPPGKLRVAIAEEQTSGRGRHNREWVSKRGRGLYQSLSCTLQSERRDLSALTLALGVGVLDALATVGVDEVMLKWPNDLVARDAKLGGLLVETRLHGDELVVVAGIGINVAIDDSTRKLAASAWANDAVSLADLGKPVPDRNALASAIINSVTSVVSEFGVRGLAAFLERWRAVDWLRGRSIQVESPTTSSTGIAAGIGDDGALLLQTDAGTQAVIAGTVTLVEDGS